MSPGCESVDMVCGLRWPQGGAAPHSPPGDRRGRVPSLELLEHPGPRHRPARGEHLGCVGRNRTYVVNTLMCECTPERGNTGVSAAGTGEHLCVSARQCTGTFV